MTRVTLGSGSSSLPEGLELDRNGPWRVEYGGRVHWALQNVICAPVQVGVDVEVGVGVRVTSDPCNMRSSTGRVHWALPVTAMLILG